jgi:type VI protein secretion system component Hcp
MKRFDVAQQARKLAPTSAKRAVFAGTLAVCGLGMALAAAPALAENQVVTDIANGGASTKVYLVDDTAKLQVQAVTEVHVRVNADGTLITPSEPVLTLSNKSSFSAHVAKIAFTEENNFKFVESLDSNTTESKPIELRFTPNSKTTLNAKDYVGGKEVTNGDFDMGRDGSTNSTISVKLEGKTDREQLATTLSSGAEQFTSITWTFAIGAYTSDAS